MSFTIGLISDTHITSPHETLPSSVHEHFANVDLILHAGDLVIPQVLDELTALAPAKAVRGNMDLPGTAELPARIVSEQAGVRIGLWHGGGAPEDLPERALRHFDGEKLDAIVFGHSHHPLIERRAGVTLINPGSPTDQRSAPYLSIALLGVSGGRISADIVKL